MMKVYILVLLVLSPLMRPRVFAQQIFGSIYGSVTDKSGGGVARRQDHYYRRQQEHPL